MFYNSIKYFNLITKYRLMYFEKYFDYQLDSTDSFKYNNFVIEYYVLKVQ